MVSNRMSSRPEPQKALGCRRATCPELFTRNHSYRRQGTPATAFDDEPMTPEEDTQHQSFEDSLTELESLVDTLERGELTLEQSLAAFERGIRLTRTCQKALDAAEQKVRILTAESPDAEPEPFPSND